jgi:hypothetical protein
MLSKLSSRSLAYSQGPPFVSFDLLIWDIFVRPSYNITVRFYPLSESSVKARAARAGVGSKHDAGIGGLVKIFLHEVLYDVEKVVYFDTDMLFLVDPYLLWREFDRFDVQKGQVLVSFPTLGPKSTSDVVCTCVMYASHICRNELTNKDFLRLLNLKLLRQQHFMPSTFFPTSVQTLGNSETWAMAGIYISQIVSCVSWRLVGIDPFNPDFGDQGLYFAVWKRYSSDGRFKDLGVSWDITHCRFSLVDPYRFSCLICS